MQWFILSRSKRTGPYDVRELEQMLESDKLTLDTIIIRDGSPVGRRVFGAPDLFFPDLLVNSPSSKGRDSRPELHAATRVARFDEPPSLREKRPRHLEPHGAKQTDHKEERPPKERPRHERLKDEPSRRGKRKKSAPQPQSHIQSPVQAQDQAPAHAAPPPLARALEVPRQETPAPQPTRPQVPAPKTQTPPSAAGSTPQAPASGGRPQQAQAPAGSSPAHQLPKAASEAQLKPRGDFTWAKNRVNPTAPKSIFQSQEKISSRKQRPRSKKLPAEIFYIGIGLISVLSLVIIGFVASQKGKSRVEPKLQLRKNIPAESGSNLPPGGPALVFETTPEIPVRSGDAAPSQSSSGRNTPAGQPPQSKSKSPSDARKNKNAPSKKTPQKGADTSKVSAKERTPSKKSTTPKGGKSSKGGVSTGAQLKNQVFKKVTLSGVQLLRTPDTCEPCQIPARLSDGTSVVLTSPNIQPWRALRNSDGTGIKASGFLTRNAEGTYSLIVQTLEP